MNDTGYFLKAKDYNLDENVGFAEASERKKSFFFRRKKKMQTLQLQLL